MLARGAVPNIGICVFTGGLAKQAGHSARTAFRSALVAANVNVTLAEIIPATNVPWPLLPALRAAEGVEHEILATDDRAVEGEMREAGPEAGVDHRDGDAESRESRARATRSRWRCRC